MEESKALYDTLGRRHDYLRISLTPHCNLRCFYCMPNEEYEAPASHLLMQADEIDEIVKVFARLGVKKIRLTGGEPLLRKDAADIIRRIAQYDVHLAITSNGTRVHQFLPVFKETGIRSINISLDTLDAKKFETITRRNQFEIVWQNIERLLQENFHVKLNVVMMKDINDNEIVDFVRLTKDLPIHIRFIEFMPFEGNHWNSNKVFSWQQMLFKISNEYDYYPLTPLQNDTAKSYQVYNHAGTFAVISTMTAPFCDTCNRIRLTADGKLKNCLFSKTEVDLLTALRKGEAIEPIIRQCILDKAPALGGQFESLTSIDVDEIKNRSMIAIGG